MCVHQASRFVTITCIMQFPAPRLDEVILQQERMVAETHLGEIVAERVNPETESGVKLLAGRKILRREKRLQSSDRSDKVIGRHGMLLISANACQLGGNRCDPFTG